MCSQKLIHIVLTDLRGYSGFFHFSKLFYIYHFFFSFTMVIKRFRELRGESAFDDRSASSISKCSAGAKSDLGNGSFWVEIRDAKHVDRCS